MYAVLDFESDAIEPRPHFPPRPVGLALLIEGNPPQYISWGHPSGNNGTEARAKALTATVMQQCDVLICHNAPFDLSIVEEKWGLTVPWDKVQDTMVMAFIDDPHGELSLKPLAEQHLGEPPTERDAVKDWLVSHGVCRDSKGWGAHIAKAPGTLVGEYAIGDVTRTLSVGR